MNRDVSFRETLFPFKYKKQKQPPLFSDLGPNSSLPPVSTSDDIEVESQTDELVVDQLMDIVGDGPQHGVAPDADFFLDDLVPDAPAHLENVVSPLEKTPSWMKDYITPSTNCCASNLPYPMQHSVDYTNRSSTYRQFLTVFTSVIEPKTFKEASKDPRWIEAMKAEISALEENKTWELVPLPKGKIHCL